MPNKSFFKLIICTSIFLSEVGHGKGFSSEITFNKPIHIEHVAEKSGYFLFNLEQNDLDLVLSIEVEGEDQPHEIDFAVERDGSEFFLTYLRKGSRTKIFVSNKEWTNKSGNFQLSINELTNSDTIGFWREFSKVGMLSGQMSWDKRAERYQQISKSSQSPSPSVQLEALYRAAFINYFHLYDWSKSIDLARQAATLSIDVNSEIYPNILQLEALALIERAVENKTKAAKVSDFSLSRAKLKQAQKIYFAKKNHYQLALLEGRIGYLEYAQGNYESALSKLLSAANKLYLMGEFKARLKPMFTAVVIEANYGNVEKALEILDELNQGIPKIGHEPELANVHDFYAEIFRWLGKYDQALTHYQKGKELRETVGEQHGLIGSLLGIGRTYLTIGNENLALEFLQKSLELSIQNGAGFYERSARIYLADISYRSSHFQDAIDQYSTILSSDNFSQRITARIRVLRARCYAAQGKLTLARTELVTAIHEAETGPWLLQMAEAQLQLGVVLTELGELDKAISIFDKAIVTSEEIGFRERQAHGLLARSTARFQLNDFNRAKQDIEHSIAIIEALRPEIRNQELRAHFGSNRRLAFEQFIYQSLNSPSSRDIYEPFVTSEKAQARMLLDLMTSVGYDSHQLSDESKENREFLLNELQQVNERRRKTMNSKGISEELRELNFQLSEIEHRLNTLESNLEENFELWNPTEALTINSVRELVNDKSILIKYFLGKKESYVWLVSSNHFVTKKLNTRDEIERLAEKLHTKLSRREPYEKLALDLSRQIIEPLAGHLNSDRLVIIPDGALHYLPFTVLQLPDAKQKLIERHEIVKIPSINVLTSIRNRSKSRSPGDEVLTISDPIYSLHDERIESSKQAVHPELEFLPRLRNSAEESEQLAKLFERKITKLNGFNATKDVFLNTDLSRFRIIHFATHGIIDSVSTKLSRLELTKFNRDGNQISSQLSLSDIYGLKLNTETVVLSACETALGKRLNGEGMIGFTQGFLTAGSDSVIVTLWKIPDRSTSEFMKLFYHELVTLGRSKSAAIRAAQRKLSTRTRWRHPYYWAGYSFVGDWVTQKPTQQPVDL